MTGPAPGRRNVRAKVAGNDDRSVRHHRQHPVRERSRRGPAVPPAGDGSCYGLEKIVLASLKTQAQALRAHTLTVYYAARDPHMPWLPRVLALLVAAYALSPIDLIPDFIPVIGYLDDLVLVPLGLALVVRLTPPDVLETARQRALQSAGEPVSVVAGVVVVAVWLLVLAVALAWVHGIVTT